MSLLVPQVRGIYADWRAVASENIAALRAAHARHPLDPAFTELIDLLLRRSATFRTEWKRHEVDERNRGRWSLRRENGTVVDMDYDSLLTPDDRDQRLVFFTPTPPQRM